MSAGVREQISTMELIQLVQDLADSRQDICIRFRLIGEMWQTSHARVLTVREKAVTLNVETMNQVIIIPDIGKVMQFELDKPFKNYQPHFHYAVIPFH